MAVFSERFFRLLFNVLCIFPVLIFPMPITVSAPENARSSSVIPIQDLNLFALQANRNSSQQPSWPLDKRLHPAIVNLPRTVEGNIESVAHYIMQQERDPFLRLKAIHDYVATRINYDVSAYRSRRYPPQDAETVFKTRMGVCSGIAKLVQALGEAMGMEVAYIVGDYRGQLGNLSGEGHAWNAAKIEGNWYLIDATWDSGYFENGKFVKQYQTQYLFPPAEVMAVSHFPKDSTWQLLSRPLNRTEFLKQPMLKPRFFAEGFQLLFPTRTQILVKNTAQIGLKNAQNRWLMAEAVSQNQRRSVLCIPPTRQTQQMSCHFPDSGGYEVRLFSSSEKYGEYNYIGGIEFYSN